MLQHISLNHTNRPLDTFVRNREEMDISPAYQRGSVWTPEQRVALIKSFMSGLPIGSIILNNRGDRSDVMYGVIDGKQRIETFRLFFDDEFPVPADWFDPAHVEKISTVDGVDHVYHSNLSIVAKRKFSRLGILMSESHVETIEEEARIFRLLNTGGTAQNEESLANALAVENNKR